MSTKEQAGTEDSYGKGLLEHHHARNPGDVSWFQTSQRHRIVFMTNQFVQLLMLP